MHTARARASTFDPLSLDNDLTLVSFRGVGRGGGFKVAERFSVLGDVVLSPVVAERICDLCKMFLAHGVITPDFLKTKLGTFLIPVSSYAEAIRSYQLYNSQRILKSRLIQQNAELELQSQLSKENEKKLSNYEMLDKIIDSIFRHCLYNIKTEPNEGWYICIELFHPNSFELILDTIEKSDREMHDLILQKIRPGNIKNEFYFKLLRMLPKFKTNTNQLPEVDWRTLKKWSDAGLLGITPI
jgi:hypothetical protein